MKYFIIFLVSLLVFCSQVPQTRYFILGERDVSPASETKDKTLVIRPFTADPLYEQDQMVYKESPFEVKYDHYRRWALPPARLLTLEAEKYFRACRHYRNVSRTVQGDDNFDMLEGHIERFEEVYQNNQRVAVVAIRFEFRNMDTRQLLWRDTIEKKVTISGGHSKDIVKAMSEATFRVFQAVADKF